MSDEGDLLGPIAGAEHISFGGIEIDVVMAGDARIKRLVYPPGSRWSKDVKPLVGGEHCTHAHVGFLAQGTFAGEYADGCTFEFRAPTVMVVEPGHDMGVVSDEPAVLIQFDFEADTPARLGLPAQHSHD